jgi:hypothetical protein
MAHSTCVCVCVSRDSRALNTTWLLAVTDNESCTEIQTLRHKSFISYVISGFLDCVNEVPLFWDVKLR